MQEALEEFKPDIVHLNNFQRQLSASIIEAIKEKNIPMVYTAHDVQAICPAITMMDNDKKICEKCMNGKYLNCVKKKCNKGSNLKSLLGAIEGYYYKTNKIYTQKIDAIITPSEFYKKKLIQDGISKEKIYAMHNFIEIEQYDIKISDEGYALYLGRLSKEKGIINLIKAFEKLDNGMLYIAGDGPEKENILEFIKQKKLENKIKLLGFLNKGQVKDTVSKCSFIIVPSIWYENCPYSVLETMAIGKPVIGSNMGGIPELVKNEKTGLIYNFDNIEELSEKMKLLFENRELAESYGSNAKDDAKESFSKELYYNNIVNIYNNLIKENK